MDIERLNEISSAIVQSAIEIHRTIGPGLLESAYRSCMIYELSERGLSVAAEQFVAVRYKNLILDGCYRIDLLVQGEVVAVLPSTREQAARTFD